jgi:hypothetical protein
MRTNILNMQEKLTWKDLVELDHRLGEIEYSISSILREIDGEKYACANFWWYRVFKPWMSGIVGHSRKDHRILGTSRAYDIAYDYLYDKLPCCRNCNCL